MAASYGHINYVLRPAKHVERRMVFEALRRLDRLSNVGLYMYIGFASPFFVDFRLAHRELAIQTMTNIEREASDRDRFEFNRPFGFIDLEYGEAVDVLEDLDWTQRAIVWLDFDGVLSLDQIAAIQSIVGLAASGSVIIATTNAHPIQPLDERIERMQRALGDYMPFEIDDPDLLGGWSTAALYHSIVQEVTNRELAIRNQGLPTGAQLSYRQWFNFRHRDGARMLTTGGIIFDAGNAAAIDGMGMPDFHFVRTDSDAYEIDPPNLTLREMAHLESRFPCSAPQEAGLPFLSDDEVLRYQDIYRYCPRFADVEA